MSLYCGGANRGGVMEEIYTCTCGGQKFTIGDGEITCLRCGMIYIIQYLNADGKPEFESSEDFNKRIKEGGQP